jgi:glutathione S-transferase
VLNLKGIEYDRKTIALSTAGEQFGTNYTAVNPMQQVPAMLIGEYVIQYKTSLVPAFISLQTAIS